MASIPAKPPPRTTTRVTDPSGASGLEEAKLRRGLWHDSHPVVPREARMAEVRRVGPGGLQHAFQTQVPQRLGPEISPDLVDVVARGDQVLAGRRVDAVVARPLDRRGGDAHVDLAGPCALDHSYDFAAGGSPNDRVVHH